MAQWWFSLGILPSQQGVQQGDLLGPLLSLVLQQVKAILLRIMDIQEYSRMIGTFDDGVLAGTTSSVSRALDIILGPDFGLLVNL